MYVFTKFEIKLMRSFSENALKSQSVMAGQERWRDERTNGWTNERTDKPILIVPPTLLAGDNNLSKELTSTI